MYICKCSLRFKRVCCPSDEKVLITLSEHDSHPLSEWNRHPLVYTKN